MFGMDLKHLRPHLFHGKNSNDFIIFWFQAQLLGSSMIIIFARLLYLFTHPIIPPYTASIDTEALFSSKRGTSICYKKMDLECEHCWLPCTTILCTRG